MKALPHKVKLCSSVQNHHVNIVCSIYDENDENLLPRLLFIKQYIILYNK